MESVKPFLFNLFNDRAIISLPQPLRFILAKLISTLRLSKAKPIYSQIGGSSPLLGLTNNQADALERELSFFGDFKVFVSMRYWHPMSSEVVGKVEEYAPDKLILLPLYPQFSSATSGSSLEDFLKKFPQEISKKVICCYPTDPDFISSQVDLIKKEISDHDIKELRFLFSAHGLPQSLIDSGDPYVSHIEKSTAEIVKKLPENIDYHICYQSKVGPKAWTSPNLEYELRRVAIDKKIPVIIPISFVAENSETLFELDILYKEFMSKLGVTDYLRVPTLNSCGQFIKSLTEICKNAASDDSANILCGRNPKRICEKKFKLCPNKNYS